MNYFPNYLFGYKMSSKIKLFKSSVVWCQLLDEVQLEKRSLFSISYCLDSNQLQQDLKSQFSTSAKDLLAQQNEMTKVTGVQIDRTDAGLEIILETTVGEPLVLLILPEGNLAIDLLDATLALALFCHFPKIKLQSIKLLLIVR